MGGGAPPIAGGGSAAGGLGAASIASGGGARSYPGAAPNGLGNTTVNGRGSVTDGAAANGAGLATSAATVALAEHGIRSTGPGAPPTGPVATSAGRGAVATGAAAILTGPGATSTGPGATRAGAEATSTGRGAVATLPEVTSTGRGAVATGPESTSTGRGAVATGAAAILTGRGAPPNGSLSKGHVAAAADGNPRASGKQLLRVEGLAKQIGDADILEDINFSIYEGEILGLIGPNGAGKTTLMECLAGMRPRTGGVFYLGDDIPASWEPKELLFYLPNNVLPYGDLYTIEVLTFFGRLYEVDPTRWERVILHDLSLGPVLAKRVSALSKGNMQRLLIALALMSPQPLLALDEPFDGLDLHQTSAMMGILRGLRAQSRTLLLCIHQLNDAERICDRVLLLSGGRLVGVGTLAELRVQTGLAEGSLEEIFLALTGRPLRASAD